MSVTELTKMFKKSLRSSRRLAARVGHVETASLQHSSREYRAETPLGFQTRGSHSFFVR